MSYELVSTYIVCSDQESNSNRNKTDSNGKQQRQHCARRQYRLPGWQLLLFELCVYSITQRLFALRLYNYIPLNIKTRSFREVCPSQGTKPNETKANLHQ